MFIPPDAILVGFTRDQLFHVVLPALQDWKGPCKGKPRHPTEEAYQKEKLDEAKNIIRNLSGAVRSVK